VIGEETPILRKPCRRGLFRGCRTFRPTRRPPRFSTEGKTTKPLECLDPPLPAAGEHLFWVAKPKVRGTIRANETPGPENDHALSLAIEDSAPGAQVYEIVVAW